MSRNNFDLDLAYQQAIIFTKNHYENFPVISYFIKKELRKDVAIIYWFARTADDIADEGSFSESERMEKLTQFEMRFNQLLLGEYETHLEAALHNTIINRKLSSDNFLKLLSAFKQDVFKSEYKDFNEVLDYCLRSANPVGRLILELHNYHDEKLFQLSDKICTALQLTNFYQDTKRDFANGRIYYPIDEMKLFNIKKEDFVNHNNSDNFKKLIKFNVDRCYELFNSGEELLKYLKGNLKIEISWTIFGGKEILNKIIKNDFNVLVHRPVLNKFDYLRLLLKSL